MIFKILVKSKEFIMELDNLEGIIKITDCSSFKVTLFLRRSDFNGALKLFDSNQIQISYTHKKKIETLILVPIDKTQIDLIEECLEVFALFDEYYKDERKINFFDLDKEDKVWIFL